MNGWVEDFELALIRQSTNPFIQQSDSHGFNQETPQGENQPAQAPQEAALESPQEAHLAALSAAGEQSLQLHSLPAPCRQGTERVVLLSCSDS
jgi:hypothetical protein